MLSDRCGEIKQRLAAQLGDQAGEVIVLYYKAYKTFLLQFFQLHLRILYKK